MHVLQISTGIYFSSSDLYETLHRRVRYSNAIRVRADDIPLPIGVLRFTNGRGDLQPLVLEAIDRLEKLNSDGTESGHLATGGDELIDDLADLVAFGLDVVILQDQDLAARVIAGGAPDRRKKVHLRRALEPARYISDEEVDALKDFMNDLLALERPHFEAAMRAIRRVADAIVLTASDVTLSYTLFVAALESLSKDGISPTVPWQDYDKAKRSLVDSATDGLPDERVERIRSAVLRIDMLSIRRRFQGFVLDHVTDEYYRSESIDSSHAVRAVDLPRALDFAYQVRSKTMHELRDLAPELEEIGGQDDTLWHRGEIVLTLEGLHRLCQHVIRNFVRRAPAGIDPTFAAVYRESLPGIVRVRVAPQLWAGNFSDFNAAEGPKLFSALTEMLASIFRGELDGVPDMSLPLQRIEKLLPGESSEERKIPLLATYQLWDGAVEASLRRRQSESVLSRFGALLEHPTIYSYAIALLLGRQPPGLDDELESLVDQRGVELRRRGKSFLELPPRLDAAFELDLAQRAWRRGDVAEAMSRVDKAIQLCPGDLGLMELESFMKEGKPPEVDLRAFIAAKLSDSDAGGAEEPAATG